MIWSRNEAKLYRYEPLKEKKHRVPILFIYALLNVGLLTGRGARKSLRPNVKDWLEPCSK